MTSRRSFLANLAGLVASSGAGADLTPALASSGLEAALPRVGWKLERYAISSPAPFGGVNILETALIAAGEEFRQVRGPDDCASFSRPIAAYINELGWVLEDTDRQFLLRFVGRLDGSADDVIIEQQRAEHLALATMRRIFAPALEGLEVVEPAWNAFYVERASDARAVTTLTNARAVAEAAHKRANGLLMSAHYGGQFPADLRSQASKVDALSHSMAAAANHVATASQVALPHHKGFWDHMLQVGPKFAAGVTGRAFAIIGRQAVTAALEILDEALEIGKRASLPEQVVIARLKAAKRTASQ